MIVSLNYSMSNLTWSVTNNRHQMFNGIKIGIQKTSMVLGSIIWIQAMRFAIFYVKRPVAPCTHKNFGCVVAITHNVYFCN